MKTFEERLEELSFHFLSTLNRLNEETSMPMLEILANQICLADEFKNKEMHIKEAC